MNKIIFITGGTGLVGSLLALKAVRDGYRVRLLARPKGTFSAEERIRRVFSIFGVTKEQWEQILPAIDVIQGDVTRPNLGLSREAFENLGDHLSGIIHCAAFTGFDGAKATLSTAVNIDGTRNVLKLVDASRCRFAHVSTAYIVGNAVGRVFEDAPAGKHPWKNIYEKTKFAAESEVHAFCRQKGLDYCVFRPAVLIGDTGYGRTIQFNNIYNFIKVAYFLSLRKKGARAVIEADPEACLNIVPVDAAVDAMWRIFSSENRDHAIFHIANPSPPSFRELSDWFSRILDIRIRCENPQSPGGPDTIDGEMRIGAAFAEFNRYMFGEPYFDLSNTNAVLGDYTRLFPKLDESYCRKILSFAVDHRWGKGLALDPAPLPAGREKADPFFDRYFDHFLGSKLNQQLLRNLKNLNAVVSIRLRDVGPSPWCLEIKDGILTAVSKNGLSPECGYVTDGATFKAVVSGKYPPQNAFFDGKGEIFGDTEKGLQVITALSEFFMRFPFRQEDAGA